MLHLAVRFRAAVLAVLVAIAAAPPAIAARPPMEADDLPAVRVTYPELISALRIVRGVYLAQRGTTEGVGLQERLRIGALGTPDAVEIASLEAVDFTRLPTVVAEVQYDLSDFRASRVTSVSVAFPCHGLASPHVYVHGDDAAGMAVVAAAARNAFEPHAPFALSQPEYVRYSLIGIWSLLVVFAQVRSKRKRWRTKASERSRWNTLYRNVPWLAFVTLMFIGRDLLPNVLAYQLDSGWWARHSADVLFAAYAGGMTALLLVLIRLDARAIDAKETKVAALAVWED